jgi:predicted metal-dependent HD superfamily phosphohydrolase
MTEHHRPFPDDRNGCVLSDADLAILAAEPVRYADYAAGVRREYAQVGDHDFAAGRAAVLRDLLDGPRLFATEAGARLWESTARANATSEIARLDES